MITLQRTPLRGSERRDPANRSRRRFVRRQWLRRWLVWRYVIGSVLLVVLSVAGVWLVFFSSTLTVKHVDVQGESLLSQEQVLAAAKVPVGAHLAELDLGAIRTRVAGLAPVKHVDVSRDWPDGVLIKVTERRPVAVVQIGGRYQAMDADGVLFRTYPRPPAHMPRVVSPATISSDALAEAARVIAALPPGLAARVDHAGVRSLDQVTLTMRSGATVLWGSDAQSALKAEVLVRLLAHPARTYDVSVPGQPVTSGG
ncbi:MAG TPA: FtsQ-type POTRA domain-containing protein [Nocardioides sp.]|uniref:cell division protein FtsQ/DivIB n=1 Tax=Nocardioides sp. TaxID=35761 RepID=UPI002F3E2B8A